MATISFNPALPISAHVDHIADLIRHHQVVIVAGETGSGKTTQLPKICLSLGRTRIAHTQPRRIAARTVAERIADELDVELGDLVGYQVRFTKRAGAATQLKVLTDGVLLAEIGHDRDLRRYDTIIIDEAHERSLNIDFLLGYLKQLLPRRPDLKVIITSATIDTARFSAHFDQAPIVEVSGRSYPVEIRYRPLGTQSDDPDPSDGVGLPEAIVAGVREVLGAGRGDVLVFLSGEREIRDARDALDSAQLGVEVVPLYARLSAPEQQRIFQSHTTRRVVLATNVAETSLTVPGIRFVVDTGLARISRYSARTKVQRLPIEPISKASANQRAGRCGRVAPGICVRLYSEQDFESRPEFTEPEILRTNLASVILQMAQADLGDIASFPFLEAPDRAQIADGVRLLDELGALKPGERHRPRLTKLGRQLARLPIDPRLGRMLIEGAHRGCLREVQVIVSALAIQDVRERPTEQREKADQLHRRFWSDAIFETISADTSGVTSDDLSNAKVNMSVARTTTGARGVTGSASPPRFTPHTNTRATMQTTTPVDQGGDIIALLRLWAYLSRARKQLSGNQFRRMCREEFINYLRVREWQDLHTQLCDICRDLGLDRNAEAAPHDQVLIAVLSGLLSNVGLAIIAAPTKAVGNRAGRRRKTLQEYLGARGSRFAIQPGSALSAHPPELVMAVDLVETSRLWARTVAGIRADWVEQVGEHLLKYQYSEPHWSSSGGAVLAYEKVTLFGVPIIADRLVNYSRIDPETAREMFIQAGLVEGQWNPLDTHTNHDFLRHNADQLAVAGELEERTRRRGLVASDRVIFDFYVARIPSEVTSAATFDAWWSREPNRTLLDLDAADLTNDPAGSGGFPDEWLLKALHGDLRLPIDYVFSPGDGRDGVTIRIALAQLNQVPAQPFSWQVNGLRAELATELIRSLPKTWRTNFVPAPDHARRAMKWLADNNADQTRWFHLELGRALGALTGIQVPPDAWAPNQVPEHLRVGFEIVTDGPAKSASDGQVTSYGKDLDSLRTKLSKQVSATLTKTAARHRRPASTYWSFGTIPAQVELRRHGLAAIGYPALHDTGTAVEQIVLDTSSAARRSHAEGIRRLLVLTNPDPTRWVVAHLTNQQKLALGTSPYRSIVDLLAGARLKAVDQVARERFKGDLASVRDAGDYEALALQVRQRQADQMLAVAAIAAETLDAAQRLRDALVGAPEQTAFDVQAELDNLVFDRFISFTRDPWFAHLPRYLAAALARVDAARAAPSRDQRLVAPIAELQAEFDDLCDRQPPGPLADQIDDIGFLLEELRVQIFAQQLRTSVPVSPKRIRKMMDAVQTSLSA